MAGGGEAAEGEAAEGEEANRLESFALTLIFAAVSLALLAVIGIATRHGPASAGWWTRPALGPGVALSILVLANCLSLGRDIAGFRRRPLTAEERGEGWRRIAGWLRPLEFLGYFAAYVWSIQHLGYFPSTLVFILGLLLRVGLRSPAWLLAGVIAALAMVGVFRVGLGVWMPVPEAYELAPNAIRMALSRWF